MWHDEEINDAWSDNEESEAGSTACGPVRAQVEPCVGRDIRIVKLRHPLKRVGVNTEGAEAFSLDTLLPEVPYSVADDPVRCLEMFNTVVNAFMEMLPGLERREVDGLTGNLINESVFTGNAKYSSLQSASGTVECQSQGSSHIHALVQLCRVPSSSKMIQSNLS
jgi:hypothetical protein